MINAGELDKYVELQTPTVTRGTDGSEITTYTSVKVWAKITPLQGKEFWQAEQVNSEISHNIIIRYRTSMRPDMRIKYGSRIFHILSYTSPDEKREALVLRCKEVLTGGT